MSRPPGSHRAARTPPRAAVAAGRVWNGRPTGLSWPTVLRSIVAIGVICLVCAWAGAAYAGKPITWLTGLRPDGWGQTTSGAQVELRRQYPGIIPTSVKCSGILMRGYPPWLSSSLVGLSRNWDKLFCTGRTQSSPQSVFSLVFDQKSRSSWIIYRLRGSSLTELQTAGP